MLNTYFHNIHINYHGGAFELYFYIDAPTSKDAENQAKLLYADICKQFSYLIPPSNPILVSNNNQTRFDALIAQVNSHNCLYVNLPMNNQYHFYQDSTNSSKLQTLEARLIGNVNAQAGSYIAL
ncbi:hypothetical protein HJ019_23845 [Vibrio parahaemolyticus]|nr:hypothetical protein [Vibrio parahaemolyticus]HCG5527044.1 hypothetical protein [Vibrio parahaemolyticus]